MSASAGFGPEGRRRAVVLSFDNLGEVSERQRGTWSAERPPGSHPSVTVVLPRLLDELDRHQLRATFFVEGLNCELNPEALREIAGRGHELGAHGWMHEPWGELDAGDERALLVRATRAFAGIELPVRGFRPPGGKLTAQTEGLLGELGYDWYSPAGGSPGVIEVTGVPGPSDDPGVTGGLARVPFDWELVDAYHLMERFADLRAGRGDDRTVLTPEAVTRRLTGALRSHEAGLQTVILHPFLMLDEAWFDGARTVLATIAELASGGETWVTPAGPLASGLTPTATG